MDKKKTIATNASNDCPMKRHAGLFRFDQHDLTSTDFVPMKLLQPLLLHDFESILNFSSPHPPLTETRKFWVPVFP